MPEDSLCEVLYKHCCSSCIIHCIWCILCAYVFPALVNVALEENCWFSVHPVSQQRSEGEKVCVCVCVRVCVCVCVVSICLSVCVCVVHVYVACI